MTGRTHDMAALTLLIAVFVALPAIPPMSVATAITAFGANFVGGLFPDIDQPTSDFWDNFRLGPTLSKIICPLMGGHRHISHSLVGMFMIGTILHWALHALNQIVLLDMNIIWISFMIGMASHLLADLPTKEGVPLLWPWMYKFGIPPFRWMRVTTGEWIEHLILFPALLVTSGYLLYSHQEKVFTFLKVFVSK